MHNNAADAHAHLWKLIKDTRFGMLTHRDADGSLHAQPLTVQNRGIDDNATLYFFVSRCSELVTRILADDVVGVSFSDPGSDSYVSVSGHAALIDDAQRKEDLWTQMAQAWFPGGPTDPDTALLAVRVGHAEYWDVQDSKVVQLFKIAKAAITGEPAKLGEHRELHLS